MHIHVVLFCTSKEVKRITVKSIGNLDDNISTLKSFIQILMQNLGLAVPPFKWETPLKAFFQN